MIAGLPPEYGLYTAIVTPVVAALFGSSLHLISGPTTAISIIVFTAISPLAEPGSAAYIRIVLTLTLMAGVYQLAFGLARLGTLVNFVSHSVVVGFTSDAASISSMSPAPKCLPTRPSVAVRSGGISTCVNSSPMQTGFWSGGGYLETIGRDHLFASQKEAIAEIMSHVDTVMCQHCDNPVFEQCPVESGRENR